MTGFWPKFLLTFAIGGVIAYLMLCLLLLFGQNRLIFMPSRILNYTPKDISLPYEDVWLSILTANGQKERLHGWWLPATRKSDRVLLYLHGNGENISANLNHAYRLQKLGFSVFLIDYRGYGRSEGSFPTEAQVYKDAQAAWDDLVNRRKIKPQDIFIYGHSLGGAIALDLAVRQPQAAGLIVESSFTSMRDMVSQREIYHLFPADLLLTQRFDSLGKLKLLRIPLLLIHGTKDGAIPARMSQRLFEAATVPKKLLLVPAAGHNNTASVAGEKYLQTVIDFIQLVRSRQVRKVQGVMIKK